MYRRALTGDGDEVRYMEHPLAYECKDGTVKFIPFIQGGSLTSTVALTEWVKEEGMATETLKNLDWSKFAWHTASEKTIDEIFKSTPVSFSSYKS
jgi:hypothetical protein